MSNEIAWLYIWILKADKKVNQFVQLDGRYWIFRKDMPLIGVLL